MDPVEILPVEILLYIWKMLRKQDLLSCLAVNHSWRELTQNANVWYPFCDANELNDFSSWYEVFLKECQLKWAWKVGSFNDGFVIENCKLFCCSEEYIYVVDFKNKLLKYHSSGKIIKQVDAPEESIRMYIIDDDVALLCDRAHYLEIVIFSDELTEVYRFDSTPDAAYSSGGRLWFRSIENDRMVIIYYAKTRTSERHIERLELPAGTILMPISSGWSSLYQGVVNIIFGEHQERIYKCDETPMSRKFITIFTNEKDIIVVIDKKIIAGKHVYCTVLVYRNEIKLYRADLPKQLQFWCFSGDFIVLASSKDISSLHLTNGDVTIGQEVRGFDDAGYIYGIQNLFKYSHIPYVIVEHFAYFSVFDVRNQCDIIKVVCDSDILLCVSQMFVYCLKDQNKIKVKRIKL